jgi:hypothetical protein
MRGLKANTLESPEGGYSASLFASLGRRQPREIFLTSQHIIFKSCGKAHGYWYSISLSFFIL